MANPQPMLAKPGTNSSTKELEAWVFQQYLDHGFNRSGFKGYASFKGHLGSQIAVKQVRNRVIEVMNGSV
jgi:hypothetical protein